MASPLSSIVPSLVLGDLLSQKQRTKLWSNNVSRNLITLVLILRKFLLRRLMSLQLEYFFLCDCLTICYILCLFQTSLKGPTVVKTIELDRASLREKGASLSWFLFQGNEISCEAFGVLGLKKVISPAFVVKALPAFPLHAREDGSAISLTFLSELVFEPLDDSDKCHCCHWLSFNYTWLKLSMAASRKLN